MTIKKVSIMAKKRFRFHLERYVDVIAENEKQADEIFCKSDYDKYSVDDLGMNDIYSELESDADDYGFITFTEEGVVTEKDK
jgi:hypothetical protein